MRETEKRKFRYENKYMITIPQLENLRNRIEGLCELDKYSLQTGDYNIRSLYFDDYSSSSYYDNEIGIDPREKYRIRIYNCSDDVIILERKIKVNGKISKDRTPVSRKFFDAVINENYDEMQMSEDNPLINRFVEAYCTRYLRPRIIVDYRREAYISEPEDIRITFDKYISFSTDMERFFEKDLFLQPIMPVGKELLEVKFTEILPEHIHRALDVGSLRQSTFSKYYLSEKARREEEW